MGIKSRTTVVASFLTLMLINASYAQDPFSGNIINVTAYSSEENVTTVSGDAEEVAPETKKDKEDKNEYPCEGTINCQYGQYCRKSPWGEVMTILPPSTKVTITGKEGDWYISEYNGQKAYLHYSLVDTPTTPAYDGYHPYAYADVNPNYKKEKPKSSSSSNSGSNKKVTKSEDNKKTTSDNKKIDTTKDINGPGVPECLFKGLEAAKKSQWNVSNKCLQFSGTIAEKAGAKVSSNGAGSQPQIAWSKTKDTSMRGKRISSLKEAALNGKLLPGMLIHVKAHYNEDPDYVSSRPNDGHHWFMYMGMVNGEPMFVDNIRENKLRNTETQASIFKTSKYGDRYITSIYDPFADQR